MFTAQTRFRTVFFRACLLFQGVTPVITSLNSGFSQVHCSLNLSKAVLKRDLSQTWGVLEDPFLKSTIHLSENITTSVVSCWIHDWVFCWNTEILICVFYFSLFFHNCPRRVVLLSESLPCLREGLCCGCRKQIWLWTSLFLAFKSTRGDLLERMSHPSGLAAGPPRRYLNLWMLKSLI